MGNLKRGGTVKSLNERKHEGINHTSLPHHLPHPTPTTRHRPPAWLDQMAPGCGQISSFVRLESAEVGTPEFYP